MLRQQISFSNFSLRKTSGSNCPAQSVTTLSFDFQVWPWPWTELNKYISHNLSTNQEEQINATLFWNTCISKEVMPWTSSAFDNLIIWPSRATLTLDLPEWMFGITHLLIKENICAKLFWNPCINNILDKINLWQFYHLTFKYDLDLWPTWKKLEIIAETNPGRRSTVG